MVVDIFSFIAFILSIGAYGISIYKVLEGRQSKKQTIANIRDDALLFLRDFNKEGWLSGYRVDNSPRSKLYFEQVDRLRAYRSTYPDDLKKYVDEYLDLVSMPEDQGIGARSIKLEELEKSMRAEAGIRLRKGQEG